MIATTLIPYEIGSSWMEEKEKYSELLMNEIEKLFPWLKKHITFIESATFPYHGKVHVKPDRCNLWIGTIP